MHLVVSMCLSAFQSCLVVSPCIQSGFWTCPVDYSCESLFVCGRVGCWCGCSSLQPCLGYGVMAAGSGPQQCCSWPALSAAPCVALPSSPPLLRVAGCCGCRTGSRLSWDFLWTCPQWERVDTGVSEDRSEGKVGDHQQDCSLDTLTERRWLRKFGILCCLLFCTPKHYEQYVLSWAAVVHGPGVLIETELKRPGCGLQQLMNSWGERAQPEACTPGPEGWAAASAADTEPDILQKLVWLNIWKAVAKSCLCVLSGLKAGFFPFPLILILPWRSENPRS